jgi:hypothetical protein
MLCSEARLDTTYCMQKIKIYILGQPPRESTVWVDGGTVEEEDDLWSSILEQLDGCSERSTQESQETTAPLNGKMEAQAGKLFIKGTGTIGANYSKKFE